MYQDIILFLEEDKMSSFQCREEDDISENKLEGFTGAMLNSTKNKVLVLRFFH